MAFIAGKEKAEVSKREVRQNQLKRWRVFLAARYFMLSALHKLF